MQLTYNGFNLASIGDIEIKFDRQYEEGEAPQRSHVMLTAVVRVFQRSYSDNFAQLKSAQAALAVPNSLLTWTNDATGENYFNQTATLLDENFPEEWGSYFQSLELKFSFYENVDTAAQNLICTMTAKGGATLNLANVTKWTETASTKRFSNFRSNREETRGVLTVEGIIPGDTTQSLATRRASLASSVMNYRAAMNNMEGTLSYGAGGAMMFTGVVRVDTFEAVVDQAISAIRYKFSANYTLYPNEATYTTVEATAEVKDNMSGELTLSVTGTIQGATEALTRTKLASVIASFLTAYGFSDGQQLTLDTTPNLISANKDGDTFTELKFSGSWRNWQSTNQLATVAGVTLGNVNMWEDGIKSERLDPLRPHRRRVVRTINAGGVFAADPTIALVDRRKELLVMQRAMTAACGGTVTAGSTNNDQVTLAYGDWSGLVRVESFTAKINQAETGIDWTLQGYLNTFPNEAAYTTVEATADVKDNMTGETVLTVNGTIQATNETLARTKMAAVITTFLVTYGYNTGQQLELSTQPNLISANADGDTFTELKFTGQWRTWRVTNMAATFQRSGAGSPIPFGQVRLWDSNYKAERFDTMRSERSHATGSISASGVWPVSQTLTLTQRRAALLAMQVAMQTEVTAAADGLLKYGTWQKIVRVEDFSAKINQAETGIDWTLSASYSSFPNEGGYATMEFTVDQRQDNEMGDAFLTLAGEIQAPNGALARAALLNLQTSVLKSYGYLAVQQVRNSSTTKNISANGDRTATVREGMETPNDVAGVSFIRLSFSQEYRQRAPGLVISSKWTVNTHDDTSSGLMTSVYSGSVTASGSSADAALAAASAQALILGANKQSAIDATAYLKSQQWSIERRQLTGATAIELVSLSFSYEYISKMATGRSYVEVNTATQMDSFGPNSIVVSGFVVDRDEPTMTAIYQAQVRAAYNAVLVRSESTTFARVLSEASLTTGFTASSQTTQNPVAPATYNLQSLRLEFNFTAHSVKPAGRVTGKYAISVARDFLNLKLTTHIHGTVLAATPAAAYGWITTQFGSFGSLVTSDRNEDHDFTPEQDAFIKVDFDDTYEAALTGVTSVIEMHVTESIKYSSTRWVIQPLPFDALGNGGVSIVQPTGIEAGGRTVRGSATAATQATAEAWAWQQQSLLTGDLAGGLYPLQPEMETDYEFVPMINGIAQGAKANVRVYRVNFTFGEILPWYPAPE